MRFSLLPLALAATLTFAQSLQEVITGQSASLSTLNAWLTSESLVYQILGSAEGITLLAPSNNALAKLYGTPLATDLALDPNLLAAFLSYHVLDGVYPMSDFATTTAMSAPTFLNLPGYSNVTGGQVVQSRPQNGGVAFVSGNNVLSNVQASVCTTSPPSPPPGRSSEQEKTDTELSRTRTSTTRAEQCTSSTPH